MGLTSGRRWMLRAAVASVAMGAGTVLAEDLWVSRPYVDVLSGKSSLYPVVIRAEKGAKLSGVDHQGRWIHVQYNGKDGYIIEDAVSTGEVHTQVLSEIKGDSSSGASAANAGKGFTPSEFASAKGLSEEPLKKLEATVASVVTPQSFDQFMVDGKIGEDKPVPATQP